MILKWLIYCRVSSIKQVKEWNWLTSQEQRCRNYAKNTLWVEVEKVFNEEWVSWWIFERKSIKELLAYIDTNKNNNYVVIFEDLNRLSRDIQVHTLLRNEFRKRWVELQCPNFQFEETPEWTFRENMSVSMAQYEKDKNRQRVNDRMRARLEQWFWCFKLPMGYKYTTNSRWWKEILLDEWNYKIVKSALEKYASDELKSINDVVKYFHKKWIKVWTIKNWKVYNSNLVSRMLRNILYSWYLEFPKWNIERRKAKHKAIITLKEFERIQKKVNLTQQNIVAKINSNLNRVDIREDFPLRWFLYCEESHNMLSSAWSKGKLSDFPYYVYPRKSSMHWKSISRDKLHLEFEELLSKIKPKEELINAFENTLNMVIEKRNKDKKAYKERVELQIKIIDRKIEKIMERIWKARSEVLIENYERQIENFNEEKEWILKNIEKGNMRVWTPLKSKLDLVRNSLDIWKSSNLENKKLLLKNIFPKGIPINKNKQV